MKKKSMKGARSNGNWVRPMGIPPTQMPLHQVHLASGLMHEHGGGVVVRRVGGGWTVKTKFEIPYHKTTIHK